MHILALIVGGLVIGSFLGLCLAFFIVRGVFGFIDRFWKRF
jgi:hypothetical protein